ncbi:MAG TPA: 6-phosphofructokinase, partial [Halanaerobiales bacterium]|nr:6-phosphofructokinase [Halanaerobiales bacterium]
RTTGFLTMMSGLAGGADAILIPEEDFDLLELCDTLLERQKRGLLHNVILMAEGVGGNFKTNRDVNESYAYFVSRKIAEKTGQETRVIILGHLQRGGSPSVMDRIRASQMGAKAVEALINGETSIMVGVEGKQIVYTKINDVLKAKKEMDRELYHLEKILT